MGKSTSDLVLLLLSQLICHRPYNDGNNPKYIFDSYVYRAQISDSGFDEITDSSGVPGSTQ